MKPLARSLRMESKKREIQASEAESLFVTAIQETDGLGLPREAFSELARLKRDDIHEWANRWSVCAPCVLAAATAWCDGGWEEGWKLSTYRGVELPEEWITELRKLNALEVDGRCEDVLASVLTEGEQLAELARLRRDFTDGSERRECERFLTSNQLPEMRSRRLAQDQALAPIGADPLRESCDDFLVRAKNHWEGRANRAREHGYLMSARRPELAIHIEWLLRNRLSGESTSKIAASARRERRTVEMAITSITALLQLAPSTSRKRPIRRKK